jgi:hypothetical protein
MLKMLEDNMEVDVSLLLALFCLMLLSEIVHALIKFFQKRNVFICGYVATIKVCKSQLSSLFNDPNTCYVFDVFKDFKDLVSSKHDTIGLCWVAKALDLNASSVEYLIFHFANHTFLTIYFDPFLDFSTESFEISSTT